MYKKPKIFSIEPTDLSWDDWLVLVEEKLRSKGYIKFFQNFEKETFSYFKLVKNSKGEGVYNIGILFYDFRQYAAKDPAADCISTTYRCHLLKLDDRVDLDISLDISIDSFETMAKEFVDLIYCQLENL
jgi:hypothetical protein